VEGEQWEWRGRRKSKKRQGAGEKCQHHRNTKPEQYPPQNKKLIISITQDKSRAPKSWGRNGVIAAHKHVGYSDVSRLWGKFTRNLSSHFFEIFLLQLIIPHYVA
jgi:hypothetical protein